MDDDVESDFTDLDPHDLRGKGRMTAGVFSNTDCLQSAVSPGIPGKGQGPGVGGAATAPAWHQFDGQGELVRVGQRLLKLGVFVVYHRAILPGIGELLVDLDDLVVDY